MFLYTVKILFDVTHSGMINFIPAACGRNSDKAIFILTNLFTKLKTGDTVMVDKGFLIGNELMETDIEMIRLFYLTEKFLFSVNQYRRVCFSYLIQAIYLINLNS